MVTAGLGALALAALSFPYLMASAQSDVSLIESSGTIISFNQSPHSGPWVAEANIDGQVGSILAVFRNDVGDIFVVTIAGSDLAFDGNNVFLSGTGLVAKNGLVLEEASGSARISEDSITVSVGDRLTVIGTTTTFIEK